MPNSPSLGLALVSIFMAISLAAGTQFRVGGSGTWAVPNNNATIYNQWAEKNRFQIGDSIVFMYLPDEDSVLLVDADAYKSCNVSSHIDDFNDGNTVFSFTRSSDFYFISGNKDNCDKNEKLHVDVMANRQSNNSSLAPAPLPASPPPPPASEEPSMQPQPNKAASRVVGVMSMLVAAAGALSFAF